MGWFSNTSFTQGLKTLPMFLRPEEDESNWSKHRQGFQPCCEAGIGEPTLSGIKLCISSSIPYPVYSYKVLPVHLK